MNNIFTFQFLYFEKKQKLAFNNSKRKSSFLKKNIRNEDELNMLGT